MGEFEFAKEEEQIILRMSHRMRALSIILIVAGIVSLIPLFLKGFSYGYVTSGALWILMGLFFFFPTDNFRRIAETKDKDITELVTAFKEINKGWSIVLVLLLFHRIYLTTLFF